MEFVHHSGFIGGAWDLDTAIRMAEISLEAKKEEDEAAKQPKQVDG
jgi:hypothetical protein